MSEYAPVRYSRRSLMIAAVLVLCSWCLVDVGRRPAWPTPVAVLGSVLIGLCFVGQPTLMFLGTAHGSRTRRARSATRCWA